jgi:hypothetical protein
MAEHHHHQECVVAAIEAGAKLRRPSESDAQIDPVSATLAMIESEGARLRGYDFSALNAVLGTQALALDTIFTQLVREAVENGGLVGRHDLRLALKAQAQSRATLDSLVTHARRQQNRAQPSEKNFDEQSAANGNSASR